jgi:hypothetical protein
MPRAIMFKWVPMDPTIHMTSRRILL